MKTKDAPNHGFQCEMWAIDRPIDYPKNARKWSAQAISKVAVSIKQFGWRQPVVVDSEGVIVIGHLRRVAGKSIGLTECPVHVARDLSPAKIRALRLADNRTAQEADWDLEILAAEFGELKTMGFDLTVTGFDIAEIEGMLTPEEQKAAARATLSERFGVPPFSVLDARQGYWQDRKRAWLALGIQSELGRGGGTWRESETGSPIDRKRAYDEG